MQGDEGLERSPDGRDGREEPKLGYVVKVDDGWFLGSGMYTPAD